MFVGKLRFLFWISGDLCPGFKSQDESLTCMLRHLCADSSLVRHLLTSSVHVLTHVMGVSTQVIKINFIVNFVLNCHDNRWETLVPVPKHMQMYPHANKMVCAFLFLGSATITMINYYNQVPWIKGNSVAIITTSSASQCAIR